VSVRRFGLGLVCVVTVAIAWGACLADPGFACTQSDECVVHDAGRCEASGWCSYPDEACESERRYGPHAPGRVAGECVEPGDGDTGSTDDGSESTDEGGSDGPDGPPVSACGNGQIDPGETCDDGNRSAGDTCHPHCVESGTVLWTVTYDGDAHSEDKGFGVAVDPARESFYVAGFESAGPGNEDILVQRRWIENGELVWSRTHGGDAGSSDFGEHVAVMPSGDVVVIGIEVTAARGGDVWLRAYDPDGNERWTTTHDEAGLRDHGHGVAVTPESTIVAVGAVTLEGETETDAWIQRFDATGSRLGDPILRGRAGSRDEALDTIVDGEAFLLTGLLTDDAAVHQVWTARYGADAALVWEDLATQDPVGNEARGVGMALDPMGGVATAGVLSNDIWVQRYDAEGTPGITLTEADPEGSHDEAADVVFTADGRFLVVGFLDFATVGFATGDVWVRLYAPDGTPIWTDTYEGPSMEIDKALAVELTDDASAIVVGYETVPGQSRDVWMRRYAL
jgi:cysteine-rich repeat protein